MRGCGTVLQLYCTYIFMMPLSIPEGDICLLLSRPCNKAAVSLQGFKVLPDISTGSTVTADQPRDPFLFTGCFLSPGPGVVPPMKCSSQVIDNCVFLLNRDDSIANQDNTVCPRRWVWSLLRQQTLIWFCRLSRTNLTSPSLQYLTPGDSAVARGIQRRLPWTASVRVPQAVVYALAASPLLQTFSSDCCNPAQEASGTR